MLAEQILKVTDKKRRVILSDGSSFVLYAGELRRYHIREGEEIPQQVLDQILGEVLTKRAKLRCMNLLKASDRTVGQLKDRLKRDGYPDEIIDTALSYVASYHYTDDERYAENYIRSLSGKKSRKMITLELEKRGVDRELIVRAYEAVSEEESRYGSEEERGDLAAIRRLIEKRHYDPEAASWEEEQKLTAYLVRKGFSLSDIRQVMREDQSS